MTDSVIVQAMLGVILTAAVTAAAVATDPRAVDLSAMGDWDIVVGADASASELYAAEELQRYFAQAGGVELPIRPEAGDAERHVFIGASAAMRDSAVGFSTDEFGPEDLRIVVRDDLIVIAGGRPRGTLYGVYTFLEKYMGVRFLTADHTHVPPLEPGRRIGPVDYFYHPPLDYRWVGYEVNYDRPDYCARLRLNTPRFSTSEEPDAEARYGERLPVETVMIGHSFNHQVPPAEYAAEHPEYYCLRDGVRWASLKPGEHGIDFKEGSFPYGMQPCLTHPDVLRIVTESVLRQIEQNPTRRSFSVAPNDGGAFCECPTCLAIDQREGSKMGSVLTFVNAVAEEVAKMHPDIMIGTLAYSDTAAPPRTVRPRDNVQIMWCSINTCFLHTFDDPACPTNVAYNEQLRKWASTTKHLYAWNYYMNDETRGYQLPLPNLRLIGHNVRYQASLGVRGFFMQATTSEHGNEFEELRNYLLSNLMWDPSRDSDQLMSEWLDLHYGPAAPPIKRWVHRLHVRSADSGRHCRCLGGKYADYGLDETDIQAGLDAIEQATRLAGDDEVLQSRVEKAAIWACRAALEPVWYRQPEEKIDPALAQRMRPIAKRFFDLCKEHDVTRTRELSPHLIEEHERQLQSLLGAWDAS